MSRLETSRYLFSEAVERNWGLQQYDIEQAFPTAHLPEPVYMEVPKLILVRHAPPGAGDYKNPRDEKGFESLLYLYLTNDDLKPLS